MRRDVSSAIRSIIEEILEAEGGYVNDPADPGGPTKHGISLRYAKSRGLMFDLDGDGDVDINDIKMITPERAFDAFYQDFYIEPGFDSLPADLAPQMTDFAVNSGPGRAIKTLQAVVTELGYPTAIDGALGPMTIAAVTGAVEAHGLKEVNNTLVAHRIDFFRDIVRRRPASARFLRGWLRRAQSYLM